MTSFITQKVVLNYDINKTILMRDNGVPVPAMLNSLMSESVWGLVPPRLEDNSVVDVSLCEGSDSLWKEIGELERSEITSEIHVEYSERYTMFLWTGLVMLLAEILLSNTRFRKLP